MAKKGILVLFILVFGMLTTVVYAGPYMVIVLDVEKGTVEAVYDSKAPGKMDDTRVVFSAKSVPAQKLGALSLNGKKVEAIADYTVIRTHSSPGCTTYTFGGQIWTVCNP